MKFPIYNNRNIQQLMFLREFIGSFKGYKAGKMNIMQEDSRLMNDRQVLLYSFDASPQSTRNKEVRISSKNSVPHVYIDYQRGFSLGMSLYSGWKGDTNNGHASDTCFRQESTYIFQSREWKTGVSGTVGALRSSATTKSRLAMCSDAKSLQVYVSSLYILLRTRSDISSDVFNYELIGLFVLSLLMYHLYN